MTKNSPNALLVFPKFNPNSFWNLQAVCDIWGARCPAPPLGLITVAALLPPAWNLRLVNRNAEELTDADLAWADLVMTGGMLPQQDDALAIIELCRRRGKPVAVGGPDAMSSPDTYRHADFLVLGEAEGLIDQFVAAWSAGAAGGVFEGVKFQADVTASPTPRFDLLKFEHYLYVGVQFSRGCPFNCEFCDIIELYGRVPRAKTNAQMLAELDTLYRARPSRPCRLRRRQPDRQQEGAQALPAGFERLAEGARLPVPVLHRSLDESRRRCRNSWGCCGRPISSSSSSASRVRIRRR